MRYRVSPPGPPLSADYSHWWKVPPGNYPDPGTRSEACNRPATEFVYFFRAATCVARAALISLAGAHFGSTARIGHEMPLVNIGSFIEDLRQIIHTTAKAFAEHITTTAAYLRRDAAELLEVDREQARRIGTPGPADVESRNMHYDRQSRSTDLTLAKLAADVYRGSEPGTEIDGFIRLDESRLQQAGISSALLTDPKSGFRSGVYQNAEGKTVVSFAGTAGRDIKSWKANIFQGTGLSEQQYRQAGRLGKVVKRHFGADVVLTGHSLGGGLAATAALKSGAHAVTFNAASVSDQTIARLGVNPAPAHAFAENGQVRNYVVEGDPLTTFQESHLGRRSLVGAVAGVVVGSSVGAGIGAAAGRIFGQATESAGRSIGGFVGAAVGGASGGSVAASALSRVRPGLGHQIVLPDPEPSSGSGVFDRIGHAIGLHGMTTMHDAMARFQPWSAHMAAQA
ncbi:hypothetical protein [Nocardia colli]|uniref:hypothetical protein n=1 Tax=Nocardia colli TaxID=2545717 RepID=UPI0035E37A33